MITQVLVRNGPNLGRLGVREPDDERELISWVHKAAGDAKA